MKIVSNTGPIIALAAIDKLLLLENIVEKVFIPPIVHRELLGKIGNESQQIDDALNKFILVTEPKFLDPTVNVVIADLDEGERQAVGLASNFSERILLLLDDHMGRRAAKKLNIPTTGVIGILLLMKEKGLIGNVSPLIYELRDRGYWLSDEIIAVAKSLAGEE